MPLLLLLCLTVACLPLNWPEPPLGIGTFGSSAITAGIVLFLVTLAWTSSRNVVQTLRHDPAARDQVSRGHSVRRILLFFMNIAGFGLALASGWGWVVRQQLTIDRLYLPGAEFVILAPYLIILLGSWLVGYDAEIALHNTSSSGRHHFWTRPGYVVFLLRHHLIMVFLPVILMVTQMGFYRLYPELLHEPWAKVVSLLGVFCFIVLVPSFIPLFLGLKPMPPGYIRDRLEQAAQRLNVRYRRLYVWDTRSGLATAMVAGIVPRLRHIVFTDLLLRTMPDDEVEAVFGHEVGHVKHGHLLYYAAFLLLSFTAIGAAFRLFETSTWVEAIPDDLLLTLSVVVTGTYLFIVFGYLSRRCERQADIYGCRAMSCGDPECKGHDEKTQLVPQSQALCRTGVSIFIHALERVEDVNGMMRGSHERGGGSVTGLFSKLFRMLIVYLGTWQHSTISKRIAFLRTIAVVPQIERRFQARLTLLRWILLIGLLATSAWLMYMAGWREVLESL